MNKIIPSCLNGHGLMILVKEDIEVEFRGVEFIVRDVEFYRCKKCKLEVGNPEQTGIMQKKMIDRYEEVTGEKIKLKKLQKEKNK